MKRVEEVGLKQILKAGVLMLLLSIVLLSTKLSFDTTFDTSTDEAQTKIVGNMVVGDNVSGKDSWTKYVNEEYQISFTYPSFLTKNEYRNQGSNTEAPEIKLRDYKSRIKKS